MILYNNKLKLNFHDNFHYHHHHHAMLIIFTQFLSSQIIKNLLENFITYFPSFLKSKHSYKMLTSINILYIYKILYNKRNFYKYLNHNNLQIKLNLLLELFLSFFIK